jgi:long-chain acyl-CoA synthetase
MPPADDELMTLIYTSGSTGDPKGVMITHGNVKFAAAGFIAAVPPGENERLFSYLPLAHVFERVAVGWCSAYYPAEVYFLGDLATLSEELARYAPTRMYGVPLVWGRIQAGIVKQVGADRLRRLTSIPGIRGLVRRRILTAAGLQNARTCISGSAPLPIPVLEWFDETLGLEILQGYSLSETTLYATANLPGANRLGSVGRALPGCELRLSDEGEILIGHGAVMPGYYKAPDKTSEALTDDGFLRTGDKGRIDEDGYVWITGRTKEIFKTLKGKYVAPAPIEGAMRRNGALDQVCLVGAGLNQPILLATLSEQGLGSDPAQVQTSLLGTMGDVNGTLEPHEKIGKIVVLKDAWSIDNGLLTPTLKVKSAVVEERFAALIAAEAADRQPFSWED